MRYRDRPRDTETEIVKNNQTETARDRERHSYLISDTEINSEIETKRHRDPVYESPHTFPAKGGRVKLEL